MVFSLIGNQDFTTEAFSIIIFTAKARRREEERGRDNHPQIAQMSQMPSNLRKLCAICGSISWSSSRLRAFALDFGFSFGFSIDEGTPSSGRVNTDAGEDSDRPVD